MKPYGLCGIFFREDGETWRHALRAFVKTNFVSTNERSECLHALTNERSELLNASTHKRQTKEKTSNQIYNTKNKKK